MVELAALLSGVAGIAVGLAAGILFGRRVSPSAPWLYWVANAAVFAAGVAIDIQGLLIGALPLAVFGAGLVAGGVAGLKYGFGRVRGMGGGEPGGEAPADAGSGPSGHRAYPRDEPGSLTAPLGKGKEAAEDRSLSAPRSLGHKGGPGKPFDD